MGSSSSRILSSTHNCHGRQRDGHPSSSRNPRVLPPHHQPGDFLLQNDAWERHQDGHISDPQSSGNCRSRSRASSVNTVNHDTEHHGCACSEQDQESQSFLPSSSNCHSVDGHGPSCHAEVNSENRKPMEGIVIRDEISEQTSRLSDHDRNFQLVQQFQRNKDCIPAPDDDHNNSNGRCNQSFGQDIISETVENRISSESSRVNSHEFAPLVNDGITVYPMSNDLAGSSTNSSPAIVYPASTESVQENVGGVTHFNEEIGHVEDPVSSLPSEEIPSLTRGRQSEREARRNTGRRFWDALTRAASHRRSSNPITIVAIEEVDEHGSSSRWNLQQWRAGSDDDHSATDSAAFALGRTLDFEERRRRVRSQVWALQRLSSGLEGFPGHSRNCPAGGQSGGSCSCGGRSLAEDTTTRASISRIIMLAEALFEVLDEIHRQSLTLSRSDMVSFSSLPAPDSVVDSFPIRIHKKIEDIRNVGDEAPQCYICLVEYEEGDQVRVLPCHHDYHKGCVDKWLKEVHRVCPLCRGDVCEAA